MKNQDLMKIAEYAVSYSQKQGAKQTQASIYAGSEFTVEVRDAEIERLVEAGSQSLSLKLIIDGKVATASSSDFAMESVSRLIDNAIKRARLTSKDPYSGIPEKQRADYDLESLKLYDQKLVEMAPEKKIALAKEVEKIALENKQITKSSGSSFGSNIGTRYIVNSNGISASYPSTSASLGVSLQSGAGDDMTEDYYYHSSRSLSGLKSPEEIAKKAAGKVVRMLGAKKIPTQNVPIVFEREMTSYLLGFLAQCISGGAVYMKQSFLADKHGTKIAGDNVTILDNPLIPGLLGTRPFDGEGVCGRKNAIIDKGTLKSFLLDTYSAKKLNMASTGNAGGTSNFYMENGSHSPEEIIKSLDKGLILTRTIGQGTVATTGDISVGAFGLWVENGEIVHPVHEVTISTNLGKVLSEIEMIGNDLVFDRSIAAPMIKVKEITISGT